MKVSARWELDLHTHCTGLLDSDRLAQAVNILDHSGFGWMKTTGSGGTHLTQALLLVKFSCVGVEHTVGADCDGYYFLVLVL